MSLTGPPYNPLDRVELGRSVERALLGRPLGPLPPANSFPGAGLYAIYYIGDFAPYRPIAPPTRTAGDIPIYVGRAMPPGSRAGVGGLVATTSQPVLYNRLAEHAETIGQVEADSAAVGTTNLRLSDFRCRYLVVDDIWVPMAEALLIGQYQPIWNQILKGFGNHDPGAGRTNQARSPWDEVHPGRAWVAKLGPPKQAATVSVAAITAHLAKQPVTDLEELPAITAEVVQAVLEEPDGPQADTPHPLD